MVTLRNAGSQGKQLSLEMVKSSLLNEEARQKDRESISNHKALVIEGDSDRGRGGKRNPQNKDKFRPRSKSKGRLRGFYNGSLHTSRSIVDTTERIEGELIMLS